MSKTVKIIIGVVVAIIVIVVVYSLFFRNSGNASSETQKKIKSGNYGKWGTGTSPDWGAYVDAVNSLFGAGPDTQGVGSDHQAYASGWLKGMDVSRSAANLQEFKDDIQKYINNASVRKPDWKVTVGELA